MHHDARNRLIRERRQLKVQRENAQAKLIPDEEIFADAIASKLAGLNTSNQFGNFLRCGHEKIYRTCCDCRELEEFSYRCNLKWCPRCQWRIAERRRQLIATWTKHVTQPKHVVLTCKNFQILTKRRLKEFTVAMSKLRRTLCFERVKGGCVSIEITNEGNGWHLHSHWLVDGSWIDAKALSITWGNLVGQNFAIVKVLDVRGKEYCHEVCKYLAKGSEIAAWKPEQINEFVEAIHGRRFFFAFGDLFKNGRKIRAEINAAKPPAVPCDCGCNRFVYETEVAALLNDLNIR